MPCCPALSRLLVVFVLWQGMPSAAPAGEPRRRSIDADRETGLAAAVVVDGGPLFHTAQIFPLDEQGRVIGPDRPRAQIDAVLKTLGQVVEAAHAGRDQPAGLRDLVKINVYAAADAVADEARQALAAQFKGTAGPATSFVVGKLARAGALIAMDAVGLSESETMPPARRRAELRPATADCDLFAVAPSGRRVYISGQAEPSPDLAEATRRTLESLSKTLEHLGLGWSDVVQVKSFLGPIAQADVAEREIVKFLKSRSVPPLVFVEWSSSLPIEIELVVAGGPIAEGAVDSIEYITPPGMTASPVFCRVTRVNVAESIYVSGLYGTGSNNAQDETSEIFESLAKILDHSGSDLLHLAKATYYVSTEEAGTKLNEIRPKYYDPRRPPAASKAMVAGTGRTGKSITLDMIAVPKSKSPAAGAP